jgi:flavin reductase (DIM6/NTAB) family NADH-FMN oxidoreductase RutF
MSEFISFDFQALAPRESYALLTAFIQPRPIAFVSTVNQKGDRNLAPFSFFMAGGANPPSICFSPSLNSMGIEKDSLRNVRETGEFVINTVHREMAMGMVQTSASLAPDVSEWESTNFLPLPSIVVRPPRVAESLAQLECRLHEIVHHGDGPTSARYVIGEVVYFHASSALFDGDQVDTQKIDLIGRMGGSGYIDTASLEMFELLRPG